MLNQPTNHQQRNRNSVESSLHGLASMVALVAAFLVAPQIFYASQEPVGAYLLSSYGNETLSEIGVYIWTGLTTACVYFLSRAVLVLGMMFIAQRILFLAY